jgi:hypothetical protein
MVVHTRKATESIALTEVDAGFQEKRDLLTEHLRLVSGAGQCGARKFRWLKAATDCRPGFGREATVVLSFDGQCMRCNSYFFITYC